MKIFKSIFLAILTMILASSAYATSQVDDTTEAGSYLMTVPGAKDGIQQSMVFKVSGTSLTGNVQTKEGSFEILQGRIDGDEIYFAYNMENTTR